MELFWTPEATQDRDEIYDLADDRVRVLRVLHAARQWSPVPG